MEKVRFSSGETFCVGDLYRPTASGRRPAIATIGPMTYQKEQAPTEYARRLAELGYVTLAHDSRYRGESGGEPRCWENPAAKVEDLKQAVAYLAARRDVDPGRIFIVGICQGSSEALRVAAQSPHVRALATLAGHYRDHAADIDWLTDAGYKARRGAGEAAKKKYQTTGIVDYVAGVSRTDMNVGMPGDFVWVWYQPWADRGQWENRYAVMSDDDLLAYESISAARELTRPWLMFHGENCFLPTAARRHFEALPAAAKKAMVWDETPHLSYYDQPAVIDAAVNRIDAWFAAA
jgi:hypothetical protein